MSDNTDLRGGDEFGAVEVMRSATEIDGSKPVVATASMQCDDCNRPMKRGPDIKDVSAVFICPECGTRGWVGFWSSSYGDHTAGGEWSDKDRDRIEKEILEFETEDSTAD